MSRIIIGIHGLGNKVPENILSRWWESSIIEGLNKTVQKSPDFDFQLVYWADFLHPVPLDPAIQDKKHDLYVEDPYIPASSAYQIEKSSDFRKKLLDYMGGQLDRIFLNEDLSINFTSISDFIIHHFFSDLEIYYSADKQAHLSASDPIREQVCQLLARILRQHRRKEIFLIAHSMGSIIAYDVLTRYAPEIEIDTLVTIGSPLGLPIIRSKIAAEMAKTDTFIPGLKTPENIKTNWYNLADLRDKIAFYYHLKESFAPNTRNVQVIDQLVVNNYMYKGEKNPHKTYGYLRSPEMATIIDAFLSRKPASSLMRFQAFLKNAAQHWSGIFQSPTGSQ
ncbi:lysophospholipase [bacterium]|nr:lysophospholipase [bacterium]